MKQNYGSLKENNKGNPRMNDVDEDADNEGPRVVVNARKKKTMTKKRNQMVDRRRQGMGQQRATSTSIFGQVFKSHQTLSIEDDDDDDDDARIKYNMTSTRSSSSARPLMLSFPESNNSKSERKDLETTTTTSKSMRKKQKQNSNKKKHSFVYRMLNPRSNHWSAKCFKTLITIVILIDLFFFIASTEPQWEQQQKTIFFWEEAIVSSIFLLEYVARLATVTESKRHSHWFWGRLNYMFFNWHAILDALATFPFFIEQLSSSDIDLPSLTYLRVFRLLRILKTETYVRAFDAVWRVLYFNREILYVAVVLCLFLVLVTALFLYYLRPPTSSASDDFVSIASTMYIATLMLTGQGGPDNDGDLPWYTKAMIVLTGVFSVAMFAIPASMLTWGFEAEAARLAAAARRKRRLEKTTTIKTKNIDNASSSSSSSSSSESDWLGSSDSDATDEEYQKIIAGEEDDNDENGANNIQWTGRMTSTTLVESTSSSLEEKVLSLDQRLAQLNEKMNYIVDTLDKLVLLQQSKKRK